MTTAVSNNQWESMGGVRRRSAASSGEVRPATRSLSASLWSLGVITLLISAWGGIIPYLGPTFGFSADGSPSWSWGLTHTVLALAPGALGCLVAFSFLAPLSPTAVGRRRASLTLAGLVAVVCGAWFVVGPLAWPIVHNTGPYFVTAAPLRGLANQVGYSFGPGLILAACGAFAMGWAVRHNRPLEATGSDVQPVVPEESGIIRTEPVSTPLAPSMPAAAATAAPVAPPTAEPVVPAQSAAPVAPPAEPVAPVESATPAPPSETAPAPSTSPATPPTMKPAQTGIPAPDPDRAL
ncbi:MAG TPA: hypothetical protein VG205_00820 [Acidimicrobiales bacterium]|jgi:hypothetical protein|nr:hypothetical protein [Acidimicrobiales bacterium]